MLKLEVSEELAAAGLEDLIATIETQLSVGLQEPYINWVLDKLCKETVKIGKAALEETLLGANADSIILDILNHGYRS
jgi:hypothetical protein